MTHDAWCMTQEIRHRTHDIWHMTHVFIFFWGWKILCGWYQCYYSHTSRDLVSPVCGTFNKTLPRSSENLLQFLADPGKARAALQTHLSLINSLTDWLSHHFVKISLRRRHAQTVKNDASSHKTNYIDILSKILNLEGHQNCCIGPKVTAILLNGWILPNGGASSGRVCACSLHSRLVSVQFR